MNTTPDNELMKIANAAFLSDEIPGHLRPWKSAEQWEYHAPARLIIAREIERALLARKQQTTAELNDFLAGESLAFQECAGNNERAGNTGAASVALRASEILDRAMAMLAMLARMPQAERATGCGRFTDEQLQAAIDGAMSDLLASSLNPDGALLDVAMDDRKENEAPARLALIKAALARLIEAARSSQSQPVCKTCEDSKMTAGWHPTHNDPDNAGMHPEAEPCPDCQPAALIAEHTLLTADQWAKRWQAEADARNAQFKELQEWKARAEKAETDALGYCQNAAFWRTEKTKAEADLARIIAAATSAGWVRIEHGDIAKWINDLDATLEKWSTYVHPEDHDRIVKDVQDRAKAAIAEARQEAFPRLRPLAEAGPVPEGAVRYYFHKEKGVEWCNGTQRKYTSDTHFIDIHPPSEEVKPDPFAELKAARELLKKP